MLTSFFVTCAINPFVRTLFYSEMPRYFTWNASSKQFQRWKYGKPAPGYVNVHSTDALGCIYTFHPNNDECFYLRLLLVNIRLKYFIWISTNCQWWVVRNTSKILSLFKFVKKKHSMRSHTCWCCYFIYCALNSITFCHFNVFFIEPFSFVEQIQRQYGWRRFALSA